MMDLDAAKFLIKNNSPVIEIGEPTEEKSRYFRLDHGRLVEVY
jgi:hypothetical protein